MSAEPDLRSTAMSRRQRRERTARALSALAETASERRRQDLLDYVVRINMGVARTVAGRYFHRGVDDDDLVQVAYMALTRAARDFDAQRHQDFLSYAVPTIRGELKKHFRDQGWMVRPPRRVQEAQARITRAEGALSQELGRPARPSEIAAHLDMCLDDVIEALAADGCFSPSSLDRPVTVNDDGGGIALVDFLGEADQARPAAEARVVLGPVVRQLKPRDRRIVYLRFFEQRSQQEIADEIGVTQMQVSRLLARILRDLRRDLTAGESVPREVAEAS
ncbi:sigma-70 family RNA polymerase sigma factor [Nocardioides sp.]|uniref:sigma-70 family RNA polymerase sigma factor n=1 Tax=Nocardioides sp. TaxID=35761 RepID=UPI002D7EAFDA|nr:sigma-70 family RNA polymerase sigma factor [Nocardioides sp.]HET8959733.1 sigma-70 family RNA polymerase sigma factor [Nocardioides sp.]